MKIKTDFITNSSSTNFIVMSKGVPTLHEFLMAVGISQESMFVDVFKHLFECFTNNLNPGLQYARRFDCSTIDEFVEMHFSKDTLARVKEAEANGFDVYIGSLSSDNDAIETLFCCDSFVIDSGNLVIDATENSW